MDAPRGASPPPLLRERPSQVQPGGTVKRTLVNEVPSTFRYEYVPCFKTPFATSIPKYTTTAAGVADGLAIGVGIALRLGSAASCEGTFGLAPIRSPTKV